MNKNPLPFGAARDRGQAIKDATQDAKFWATAEIAITQRMRVRERTQAGSPTHALAIRREVEAKTKVEAYMNDFSASLAIMASLGLGAMAKEIMKTAKAKVDAYYMAELAKINRRANHS